MANSRVLYQINGNTVGTILSEAVQLTRRAHDAMTRAYGILAAIGGEAGVVDIETVLNMPHDVSNGAALWAIIGNAKTGLDTIAADMGRVDQG